jgi:hypothetical protein
MKVYTTGGNLALYFLNFTGCMLHYCNSTHFVMLAKCYIFSLLINDHASVAKKGIYASFLLVMTEE